MAQEATKDRLVDATIRLLKERGPSGTGTAQILEQSRTQRGSLYFFFPDGKDQLVRNAVVVAGAEIAADIAAVFDLDIGLPERMHRYFEVIAQGLLNDDFRLGCAVGATTLDLAAVNPTMQAATSEAFTAWITSVAGYLRAGGMEASKASSLAMAFVAAIEGATLLARALRDVEPLLATGWAMSAATADALQQSRSQE